MLRLLSKLGVLHFFLVRNECVVQTKRTYDVHFFIPFGILLCVSTHHSICCAQFGEAFSHGSFPIITFVEKYFYFLYIAECLQNKFFFHYYHYYCRRPCRLDKICAVSRRYCESSCVYPMNRALFSTDNISIYKSQLGVDFEQQLKCMTLQEDTHTRRILPYYFSHFVHRR